MSNLHTKMCLGVVDLCGIFYNANSDLNRAVWNNTVTE